MLYGTRGNMNAKIMLVGEAYGENEDRLQQPFMGASGQELESMLKLAGVEPKDCFYTNVVNARPANNEMTQFFVDSKTAKAEGHPVVRGLHPQIKILEGIMQLEKAILTVKPELIIGLGNYALWGLTESDFKIGNSEGYKVPTGITSYRGSHLRSRFGNIPLLPTYPPAGVLRNIAWRPQVITDFRNRIPKALSGQWDEPEWKFIIEPTFDQVMEVLTGLLMRASLSLVPITLACDIETVEGHIECIGFAWSNTEALCIPIMCSKDKINGYWTAAQEMDIVHMIHQMLSHPMIEVAGQNFTYDYQYLNFYWSIAVNYLHDTMLAQHVCYPGTELSLLYLSSLYAQYHRFWKDDGKEASKNHNDLERWRYNCRDCIVTFEVLQSIFSVIESLGLEEQYAIQMTRARAAARMSTRGIRLNKDRRGQEKIKHAEALMNIEGVIDYALPESIYPRKPKVSSWYTSPTQLADIFYNILGVRPVINRMTGQPTTDDDALRKIGAREPALLPLITKIQEFRSMRVFGDFLAMKVDRDGRMRASFSPTAETFRYRSGKSAMGGGRNMQNLPVGNEKE